MSLFIAMNHFQVAAGRGAEFERRWRDRKSYLDQVPGFVRFHLVRGKDYDDGTHRYASHTIWESREAFLDWTHSEPFRKAHGGSRMPEGVVLGHPVFRGWEAVDLG
jgi:heme-degrading monooxygenase HmoA